MAMVCPYCRCEVAVDTPEAMVCEGCGTPHHRECYEENTGCTLFGCKFAPPDDPKVQVTSGDVSRSFPALPAPYVVSTGFGDVNAPMAFAAAPAIDAPPPPPPPPGPLAGTATSGPTPTIAASTSADTHSTLFNANPTPPKSRLTYILLGIFLGAFGVHNFYAGYFKRGVAQLGLTVLTVFYGSFVTWIWALVEVCTVERDGNNINFV